MKLAAPILSLLLLATAAFAQEGPFRERARNIDELKTFLNLTDQQVTDLQALQTTQRQEMRSTMRGMAEKHKALREAMQQDPPDANLIGQLTVEMRNARNQLKEKRGQYREQALTLLTEEQKAALATLQQAQALQPAIRQAVRSNLLEAPEGHGPGPGFRGPRGPRGPGAFRLRGGAR